MRIKSIPLCLLLGLSISLFAQTPAPQPTATPKPKYQRVTSHVVLISISGLQGLCVTRPSNCATPMVALQRWRERGVVAQTAEGVYPTQTLPAHATMLTGRLPVDHKVTTNQHFDETRGALSETNLDNAQHLPKENLLSLLEKEKLSVAAIGFPMTAQAAITANQSFAVITQPSTRKIKETLAAVVTRDRAVIAKTRETLAAVFRDQFCVRAQSPFALDDFSAPEPDIAVVPGQHRDYSTEHPPRAVLLVEVSDTTLAKDRGRKLRAYARNGVPEYWIVNLQETQIEVYRDPQGETYGSCLVFRAGQTIATLAEPDAPIAVADLLP